MAVFELLDQDVTQSTFNFSISQFFFQQSSNKARTGVLPSGTGANLSVSQTTSASGSVQVQAGTCVIADASVSQGAHVMSSDSTETIDILGPNPATSLPRIDLIVMDGGTGELRAVTGSPASVPTAPALPATSLALALVAVGANASTISSGDITDARVYTALRGAPLYVNNLTERAAVAASCGVGQQVWVISAQKMFTKNSDNSFDDIETSGCVSAASGWSITDQSFLLRAGVAYINTRITRTGADVSATASGNFPGDLLLATVIPKYFPDSIRTGLYTTNSANSGEHGTAAVYSDGRVVLLDCNNNGVIRNGQIVTVAVSYPR